MKRYIREGVENLKGISFQMPGHKQRHFEEPFDYITHDVTETHGTDNLLDPKECIRESERELERIFGTKRSYYMVNGSSGSLIVAINAATVPGDTILVQRNCHKSVFNAAIISRLNLKYFDANYDEEDNLITDADPAEIERQLIADKNIKCVVVTSPNYFGVVSDIKKIAEVVHKHGAVLVVDEAHGAHFQYSGYKEHSAVCQGADLVIHSPHKTLPALTQTSMLHLCSDRVSEKKVMKSIVLFTTTSPSYVFTQNMEAAADFMEREGKRLIYQNIEYIDKMEKDLKDKVVFYKSKGNFFKDPMKVLFRIPGMIGFDIVRSLYFDYNIRVEMADFYYVLCIATVMNTKEDYEKLTKALLEIAKGDKKFITLPKYKKIVPNVELKAYEAFYKHTKEVLLKDSVGKISAKIVAPYPPGVPLLVPGELITQDIVDVICEYKEFNAKIVGLEDEMLEVIDE